MQEAFSLSNVNTNGLVWKFGLSLLVFGAVILAPTPDGLTEEGQRALAVMALSVVLWTTEALPIAVTGMVGMLLLVLIKAVPDIEVALSRILPAGSLFSWWAF